MNKPRKSRRTLILNILIIAAAVYVLYGVLLFAFQRSLLFPGQGIHVPQSPPAIDGVRVVQLEGAEGKVEAWFVPSRTSDPHDSPAVIFAHGNYETIDGALESVLKYPELGMNLLLVEYPGYGRTSGAPAEEHIAVAFAAGYDWLVGNNYGTRATIIAHGRSVGGGAVCALSEQRELAGLILQSTFTSVHAFAGRYLMPAFLVRDSFNNLERVSAFQKPVLLVHGLHDELVPHSHAERLHAAARDSKLVSFDCRHNDCPDDEEKYWNEIQSFVRKVTGR